MNYTASWRLSWEIEKEKQINVCIQPVSFLGSNIYKAQLWVFLLNHGPNDKCHYDLDKTNGAFSVHMSWEGLSMIFLNEWMSKWMNRWMVATCCFTGACLFNIRLWFQVKSHYVRLLLSWIRDPERKGVINKLQILLCCGFWEVTWYRQIIVYMTLQQNICIVVSYLMKLNFRLNLFESIRIIPSSTTHNYLSKDRFLSPFARW